MLFGSISVPHHDSVERTFNFLRVDIQTMVGSPECDIVKGARVGDDGIVFRDRMIPDTAIAKALHLPDPIPGFSPRELPQWLMKYSMLKEMGAQVRNFADADVITRQVPLSAWGRDGGVKIWIVRMQERMFFGKTNGTAAISIGHLKTLYEIFQDSGKLLAYWKLAITQVSEKMKADVNSTFTLTMAYIIKQCSGEQGASIPNRITSPASASVAKLAGPCEPPSERGARKGIVGPVIASVVEGVRASGRLAHAALNVAASESELVTEIDIVKEQSLIESLQNDILKAKESVQVARSELEQERHLKTEAEENLGAALATNDQLRDENAKHISTALLGASELAMSQHREGVLRMKVKDLEDKLSKAQWPNDESSKVLAEKEQRILELEKLLQEASIEVPKASAEEFAEVTARLVAAEKEAEAEKGRRQEVEEKYAAIVVDTNFWERQVQFLDRTPRRPDQKRETLFNTKQTVDANGASMSAEDIDKIVDDVQQIIARGPEAELRELRAYREMVRQSALEQLSYASSRTSHEGRTVEAYYQIMSLVVDMYRIASGLEKTHLSSLQWEEILRDMPAEAKEVLPRMLLEERLTAENPVACDAMLGGLKNLQVSYMMTAQQWAMLAQRTERKSAQPKPLPCSSMEVERWEKQGDDTLCHLEEQRQRRGQFLDELEYEESKSVLAIGSRRMRLAYDLVGWNREGSLVRSQDLSIPAWMVDFTQEPPAK